MKNRFKQAEKLEAVSKFRYKNRTYQPLNIALDVETDGITYHLSSEFAGEDEMGVVLDLIELERTRRNSA